MELYPADEILERFQWRNGEVHYRGCDLNTYFIYRKFLHCGQPMEHIAAEQGLCVEEIETIIRFQVWRQVTGLPGAAAAETSKQVFRYILEQMRAHRARFGYFYPRKRQTQILAGMRQRLPSRGLPGQNGAQRPAHFRQFTRVLPEAPGDDQSA